MVSGIHESGVRPVGVNVLRAIPKLRFQGCLKQLPELVPHILTRRFRGRLGVALVQLLLLETNEVRNG